MHTADEVYWVLQKENRPLGVIIVKGGDMSGEEAVRLVDTIHSFTPSKFNVNLLTFMSFRENAIVYWSLTKTFVEDV